MKEQTAVKAALRLLPWPFELTAKNHVGDEVREPADKETEAEHEEQYLRGRERIHHD